MAETHNLILYSRSAVLADWTCPRKRWYNYEYLGRGIVSEGTSLELFLGTAVHDAIAAIAHGVDLEKICQAATTQVKATLLQATGGGLEDVDAEHYAEEQASLVEGLIRGFHRQVWPKITAEHEIVAIEQEYTFSHDGLTFMSKPDLITRHKTTRDLVYWEWKTTSTTKEQWINSWSTAVQLHSSVRAVEQTLGEKITQVMVVGMSKGYSSYGKQQSVFCYGYFRSGEPPFTRETWSYEYKAGLKKYPVWQRTGGVKRWVEEMPEDILMQQFPQVPPIFINDELIDAFFRQRAEREHQIRATRSLDLNDNAVVQEVMDSVFPQHFEACNPGWGRGCSYRQICHGPKKAPLEMGFQLRQSHHQMEEDALNANLAG